LRVEGDPYQASAQLRALARDAKLDLAAILDSFDTRLGLIAGQGLDAAKLRFSASFTRNLDYYTGFVFEAYEQGRGGQAAVGGGRYDQLPQALGAKTPIPAIGAAIWIDRLSQNGGEP
jgi:ATP phosphoribosyltransferase regulatory subunit